MRPNIMRGTLLAAALFPNLATAELSLPMKYFDDESVSYPAEVKRLMIGASAQMDAAGQVSVVPTGQLFVAPGKAKVTASGFQQYATANCQVIDNELANERTASDLFKFNIEQVAAFREDVAYYNEESRAARRACTEARRTKAADAAEKCEYASEISKAVKELGEQLVPWTDQITKLTQGVTDRLDAFGRQPGGFAAATVSLFDPAELRAAQEANRGHRVTFVPVKNVTFGFTTAEEGLGEAATPEATISRRSTLGYSLVGEPLPADATSGSVGANNAIRNGGEVALGITLSRLGACSADLRRAGVFFYEFDSFAYVQGRAMVNKWAAYKRIEENSSRGGFFRTKTVHKVYEDLKGGQIHSVIVQGVSENSPDYLSEKEKLEAAVLDDLIKEMAEAQALKADAHDVLGLPTPGQNGATTIANDLQKCPHIYCQAGGFVLRGLSAIFGGSSSSDEVERNYNFKAERQYSYTTKLNDSGAASTMIEWSLN